MIDVQTADTDASHHYTFTFAKDIADKMSYAKVMLWGANGSVESMTTNVVKLAK